MLILSINLVEIKGAAALRRAASAPAAFFRGGSKDSLDSSSSTSSKSDFMESPSISILTVVKKLAYSETINESAPNGTAVLFFTGFSAQGGILPKVSKTFEDLKAEYKQTDHDPMARCLF